MADLPAWLLNPGGGEGEPTATAHPRGTSRARSLRRSLLTLSRIWNPPAPGPASHLMNVFRAPGPAALVCTALVALVVVSLARTPVLLSGLLAAPLAALALTGGWRGRPATLVAAAAVFSSMVAFPALFAWISPGQPILPHSVPTSGEIPPWALTDSGIYLAGRLVLRSTASVAWVALLGHVLPFEKVLKGLAAWKAPPLLLALLAMGHRYLAVLARSAEEIHRARLSRTLSGGPLREEQAWVGAGLGSLYRRTRRLAEEVTLAMVSRGCTAEAPELVGAPPASLRSIALPAATAALGLLLLWVER